MLIVICYSLLDLNERKCINRLIRFKGSIHNAAATGYYFIGLLLLFQRLNGLHLLYAEKNT